MTSLVSKLTAGIRHAKGQPTELPPPVPPAPKAAAPQSTAAPTEKPSLATVRRSSADDTEQSPAQNLYAPWDNLFPNRIWPD